MKTKLPHLLARLRLGFRQDAAYLRALETDLIATLKSVRHFGAEHGAQWTRKWDEVEAILHRTGALVHELQEAVGSLDAEVRQRALQAWGLLELEDMRMTAALRGIRAQVSTVKAEIRQNWNGLAQQFERYLEATGARAEAARVKLALLEKYSRKDVEAVIQRALAKLPQPAERAENCSQQEYDRAVIELENEKHEYLGMADLLKSVVQWTESPEARVAKDRSLRVVEAETRAALINNP